MRGAELAQPRPRAFSGPLAGVTAVVSLSLLVGLLIQDPVRVRYVVAMTVIVALLGFAAHSPRLLLLGTVFWLTALGMIRRVVSEFSAITRFDPLLVVGPIALGILVLAAARSGVFSARTHLSRSVLVLTVLILLGAVNPLEGSLLSGIAGLLFVLVPTLGFWAGRRLDDRAIEFVFKLVAALGVAAAAYGLVQTLVGFPTWDRLWIDEVRSTFTSLDVGGVVRPFSSFSSEAEYASYLTVAIVIYVGAALRPRYLLLAVGALAVLVPALVLESSRGAVLLVVVALGAMLGAWRRLPLVLAAGLGALLIVALGFGLRSYGPTSFSTSTSGALISHDVAGLADPLNPQKSTVGGHLSLIVSGVKSAFTNPLGKGIGSVTIASSTFGGVTARTEADPSDMAVALGLPGLVAYLAVCILGIRLVYIAASSRRDLLSIVGLGVVVVTLFQWLNGGNYSVAFLPWLVLGWTDRREEAQ